MTSLQQGAGGNKSAKFVAANPLDPMIVRGDNGGGDTDIQQQLAENVNKRLEKALDELKERHRTGTNEVDDPDRAPTGPAYQMIRQQQEALRQAERMKKNQADQQRQAEAARLAMLRQQMAAQLAGDQDDENDADSEFDDLLDDPALDELRDQRIEEMKQANMKKMEDIARGHGQYRTISQDEFLPECTGSSEYVAVHFFHKDFQRCHIMDKHLKQIALEHTECKCLRIDAEKAPFFVAKLQIRTLPTLLIFRHGKAVDRLTGFEGLVDDPSHPDEWSTRRLAEWMAQTGAIQYTPSAEDLRDDLQRLNVRSNKTIYRGQVHLDEEY